jgi:hypothetical protein
VNSSIGAPTDTSPPSKPLSSAVLVLYIACSPHALDLDDAALAPSLHVELAVELVLSDRLGGSPPSLRDIAFDSRSSCATSSSGSGSGVRVRATVLPVDGCRLRGADGVRGLSHDVSGPAPSGRIEAMDCSE